MFVLTNKKRLKASIITTLLIWFLIGAQLGVASPKNVMLDDDIKLAMLDYKRLIDESSKKQSVTNDKELITSSFPSNCLQWNAWQIKQKSKPFDLFINKYSRQYHVDSNLIRSVITAESCFKVKALSHAGAQGLMQLIPATADRFGVKNSYKPAQNIKGGVKYLKFLLDRYKGDIVKAVAAYNAGEGKVDRYKGVPPYKETKQYVKNVQKVLALLTPKPNKRSGQKNSKKAIYKPPKLGQKPGRHGWQYNRKLAPHLYKK